MASRIQELLPLSMGKGCELRMFIDLSKPEDHPDRNWSQATYDGNEENVPVVPNHWHTDHDEIMEVLEGRVIFYIDGKEHPMSAGDPPVTIPRGSIHGLSMIKGVRTVVKERTNPTGTFKAEFFQDFYQGGSTMPGFFMVVRASYDSNSYLSLPGGKVVDRLFMGIMGPISRLFVPAKPKTLKFKEDAELATTAG